MSRVFWNNVDLGRESLQVIICQTGEVWVNKEFLLSSLWSLNLLYTYVICTKHQGDAKGMNWVVEPGDFCVCAAAAGESINKYICLNI